MADLIDDTPTNTDTTPTTPTTPVPTVEEFVGEGKKYPDMQSLVTALLEKDTYIGTLQEKTTTLETDLRARKNLEELTESIMNNSNRTPQTPVETPATSRKEDGLEASAKTSVDLTAEVRRLLQEERARESRDTNIEKAKAKLIEVYGADYKQTLEKVARDLGVSTRYLNDLAASSPDGLMRVAQSVVPKDGTSYTAPPPNTQGTQGATSVRKNKAYYRELRKTNLNEYMSRKIQSEMAEEALRQGPAFYQ